MKYLIASSVLVLAVFGQSAIDPKDSSWGWADYK
jgi:hypothetical protein